MKRNEYFIEWPEIDFPKIKSSYVENKGARIMYKGLLTLLFLPEIVLIAFYQVLKFRG